jgi:hypothetical protein
MPLGKSMSRKKKTDGHPSARPVLILEPVALLRSLNGSDPVAYRRVSSRAEGSVPGKCDSPGHSCAFLGMDKSLRSG